MNLATAKTRLIDAGYHVERTLDCAGSAVVTNANEAGTSAAKLEALADVVSVEPDDPVPAPHVTSRPLAPGTKAKLARTADEPDDEFLGAQWNLRQIGALDAWDYTTGAADALTTVAILDTGIDLDNPDLAANVYASAAWNFFDDNDNVQDISRAGSGTMVAGIIGATANNGVGIAGIAWNPAIIPIKVIGTNASGNDIFYWSHVVAGICHAVEKGARVIHVSAYHRTLSAPTAMYRALTYADDQGAVIVTPVGDERQYGNPTEYPAAYQRLVIGVGANTEDYTAWEHSNTGNYVALAAPGVDVATTVPLTLDEIGARRGTGTILAAAHASGVALLMRSINPNLTPQEIITILRQSADDLGTVGPDTVFGAGLIDATHAVQRTPHRLMVSPSDMLTFEWDEISHAYRQPFQSLSNTNTGALTWTTHATVPWLMVTPPASAAPVGSTPSIASVSVTPPSPGECGTRASYIQAESTMLNKAGPGQDILVRVYLPQCGPSPFSVFFPTIEVAPPRPALKTPAAEGLLNLIPPGKN